MDLRRRLPAAVLAVIALALTAVIVSRVSAGADPAPRDTTPIVISPDADPSPTSTTPSDDDKSGKVTPRVRDDDDDDGPDDDDDDHTGRGDDDD